MPLARNRIETEDYVLEPVEDFSIFAGFCCGDDDLDDFIKNDAKPHQEQLLANTYAFRLKDGEQTSEPVAFVSIANDRVNNLPTSRKKKKFPQRKRYKDFPAVKLGRLGVDGHDINA